ncbi:MAG: acetolactate decarboxylase [Pseudomonadota bacterium]|nr:acetolactate decarboxylase [Alphaproteobacteria bacterium]
MISAYQYNTFNNLKEGNYGDCITIESIKGKGDHGIGTFSQLDGELIVKDGIFFHCRQGRAHKAKENDLVVWSCLNNFYKPKSSCRQFKWKNVEVFLLEENISLSKDFLAIKISGNFDVVKITSTMRQQKPYLSLEEVAAQSDNYYHTNINGDMIGFYVPRYLAGMQSSGLHLHFICAEQKYGGHVLDFYSQKVEVKLEKITHLSLDF